MRLSDWFVLTSDRAGNPQFFARSAFRSYYFVANTVTLVLAIFLTVGILVRYWGRLPEFTGMWLGIAIAGMLMLWARALRDHRKIRELYAKGEIGQVSPGSPLDVALHVAATMTHLGLTYTFLLVAALVVQVARALHGR